MCPITVLFLEKARSSKVGSYLAKDKKRLRGLIVSPHVAVLKNAITVMGNGHRDRLYLGSAKLSDVVYCSRPSWCCKVRKFLCPSMCV